MEKWTSSIFFTKQAAVRLFRYGFLAAILLFPAAQAQDTVDVQVYSITSTLDATILANQMGTGVNSPGTDFRIRGDVILSSAAIAANTFVSVDTLQIALTNGGSTIYVDLSGSIGGFAPSTAPIPVNFGPDDKAEIDLLGDLDESTVTLSSPPGIYQGTLVITATIF